MRSSIYKNNTLNYAAMAEECNRLNAFLGEDGIFIGAFNDTSTGEKRYIFIKEGAMTSYDMSIKEPSLGSYRRCFSVYPDHIERYNSPMYFTASIKTLVNYGLAKRVPCLRIYKPYTGLEFKTDMEAILAYISGCYLGTEDITQNITIEYGYRLTPDWQEKLAVMREEIKKNNRTYKAAKKVVMRAETI